MKKGLILGSMAMTSLFIAACTANFPGPGPADRPAAHEVLPPQNMADTSADASGMSQQQNPTMMASNSGGGAPIGGNILRSMDSIDKQKLSHALDAPIGKPTHWVNALTDISYTVTPVSKASTPNNPYCRNYTTTAVRGGKTQSMSGVACVDQGGTWSEVAG